MREVLAQLLEELGQKDAHIAKVDEQLKRQSMQDERIRRLMQIEGVGFTVPARWLRQWVMHASSRAGGIWQPGWGWYPNSTPAAARSDWDRSSSGENSFTHGADSRSSNDSQCL
jgi:hypothetical protein